MVSRRHRSRSGSTSTTVGRVVETRTPPRANRPAAAAAGAPGARRTPRPRRWASRPRRAGRPAPTAGRAGSGRRRPRPRPTPRPRRSPARRPRRIDGRTSRQLVVRPPSARITARAAKPSAWASSASSKGIPKGRTRRARPHQQVDQQVGRPARGRDPHREDRQQRDGRADQHERVELVDVEGSRVSPRCSAGAARPQPIDRRRATVSPGSSGSGKPGAPSRAIT